MKVKFLLISFVLFWVYSVAASGATGGPTEVIKETNKRLTDINAKGKTDLKSIVKVLEKSTDFKEISNSVLDDHCKNISNSECKELKDVFIDLIKYSTAKKLSGNNDNTTEYISEDYNGGSGIVKTKVKTGDRTVGIDYVLTLSNGKWNIVNYIVDDIDTIANYKKQFKRLFKKNSIDKIIADLRRKVENYKEER